MRMDSDLSGTVSISPMPDGEYSAHVVEVEDSVSKAGNPMVTLTWQIDDGEFSGRRIRYDTVMTGGKTKEGRAMPLFLLCNFLDATGTAWECLNCHNGEQGRHFYIGKGPNEDGLDYGQYVCPDCKAADFTYDTANFNGARCVIKVGSRKNEGTDRVFNEIQGYTAF